MVKSKSIGKSVGILAVLFCMDAAAVNNPVSYDTGITDCDVIKYNGEYYISGNWLKGDMLSSRDLVSWGQRKHVYSWSNTWHTQVNGTDADYDIHGTHLRYLNGAFHLYAHLDVSSGIAHAISSNIWGPYTEPVNAAFTGNGWLIDADTFVDDDGSLFYYETNRQGSSGHEIRGRTMSNLSTLSGSWDFQIQDSQSWEGSVINEGSKVFKYRGRYYMLYNGQGTDDPNYAVGCVEASTPLGFNNSGKYSDNPVISRAVPGSGPEITHIGQSWVVEGLNGFEKWFGYFAQTTADGRTQRIDRMHFFDRKLFIDGPTDRYSTGYHPAPAKPQYGGTFSVDSASLPSDWTASGGTWSVAGGELRQSASGSPRATLDRDAAENYLFEINLKFNGSTTDQQAGARIYYEDADNWMIVGIHQTSTPGVNNFYYHLREGGVDNVQAISLSESVMDLNAYHKIRVQRNGNTFKIWLDDVLRAPVDVATASNFGSSQVGLFANNADVAFDGIIYTIGWDEYDSGVQGWDQMAGTRTYGSSGVTINNGYAYKGDLMPEYEFAAQVYQISGDGGMGFTAVVIDGDNWLDGRINTATGFLEIFGKHGGVDLPFQSVDIGDKSDYNLRAVKLSDRVIFFVDGEEKLTVNKAYGPSRVGLVSWGMSARFNGIMVYRTEPDVVPSEWTAVDVGSPGFAGTIKEYDNALYMTGSGADIWHLGDEFAFAQKDISGDWEFITRVVNHDKTHYWAKAGLMFRDNLNTNSPMIDLNVSPRDLGQGGVHLQYRDAAGGGTGNQEILDIHYPIWIKLKREGSLFTGSYSYDGQNWIQVGSYTSPVASSGKVGYVLCSLNNDRIARAMFDNSEFIIPLDPGEIGNSQVINETDNPGAFTSTAAATGNGTVSYQWQEALSAGGLWVDISGATGETYAFPNQNGAYAEDTILYARRKATDAYHMEYSNVVTLDIRKVLLNPGSIGNSQTLYEDEIPEPFTSTASATGNGAVAYQWQWTLTPSDGGSWVDLDGATGETYTSPNLNGVFPQDTEVFARRKATDSFNSEPSNLVSLKLIKVFDTSGSGLFIDNFNTSDTADVNQDYATRQAGGGGTSTYNDHANYSVANNTLYCEGMGVSLQTTANFARYIVGNDFELSFKLSMDYTGNDWVSVYLVDAANSVWGANDFGVHALGPGNTTAFYINDLALNDGGNNLHVISVVEVETALGLAPGGYDKTQEHTIQLISTVGAGGTNSYDFVVDGVPIKTNLLYHFSDVTVRKIHFLSFFVDAAPGGAYIDDIALRYPRTYTKWSADNGLVGADALRGADPDVDGLDNLAEYALGGDPNVDDAATVMPTYEIMDAGGGSNYVDYVYNRRLNAASLGLTYGLNTSTNLLSAWGYVGTTYETDSATIDQDFESVSNAVPFAGEAGFVQLKVTED